MQFTIHKREPIAAQSQYRGEHKHQNCVEVYMQCIFDTCSKAMANTGWSYCAKIGNIDDHQAIDSRYAPSITYDQAFINDCCLKLNQSSRTPGAKETQESLDSIFR